MAAVTARAAAKALGPCCRSGTVQGGGRAAQAGLGSQTEPPPGTVCAGRGRGISEHLRALSSVQGKGRPGVRGGAGVVAEKLSHPQHRHRACARAEPRCSRPSLHGARQLGLCRAFTRLCLPAQNILGLRGIPRQFFLQVYETLRRIGETRSAPALRLPCSVPLQLRGLGLRGFAPRLFGHTSDRFLGVRPALCHKCLFSAISI